MALYLIGHVGFRWRLSGTLEREKAAVVAVLLVVFALSSGIDAWVLAAIVAALMAGLCAVETAAGEDELFAGHPPGKDQTTDKTPPLLE